MNHLTLSLTLLSLLFLFGGCQAPEGMTTEEEDAYYEKLAQTVDSIEGAVKDISHAVIDVAPVPAPVKEPIKGVTDYLLEILVGLGGAVFLGVKTWNRVKASKPGKVWASKSEMAQAKKDGLI